jgi:hypothetical protein
VTYKIYHVLWNFRVKFLSIKPKSKQASVDDMTKAPSNTKSKGLTKEISKVLADSLRQLGNSRLPRDLYSRKKSLDVKEEEAEEESEGEEEGVSSEKSEKTDDSEEEGEEEEEACTTTAVTTTTVTASARGTKNKAQALQLSGKNTCNTQKWATGGHEARHILLTNSQEKQSRKKVG